MKKYSKLLILLLCSLFIGCDNSQITNSPSNDIPISSEDNKELTKLDVPTFSLSQDGKIIIDQHENTNRFKIKINDEEFEITHGQTIYAEYGDLVQVKAISNNINLFTDSEYSESVVYNTLVLPRLFLSYDEINGVFELIGEGIPNYEPIYLELNRKVSETTLSEFLNMTFEVGDVIRIKYKGLDENILRQIGQNQLQFQKDLLRQV